MTKMTRNDMDALCTETIGAIEMDPLDFTVDLTKETEVTEGHIVAHLIQFETDGDRTRKVRVTITAEVTEDWTDAEG